MELPHTNHLQVHTCFFYYYLVSDGAGSLNFPKPLCIAGNCTIMSTGCGASDNSVNFTISPKRDTGTEFVR